MGRRKVVGITGGIGSGKSVVSRICRLNGYDVYDCDYEARRLMDNSDEIKSALTSLFGPSAVDAEGTIDRKHIASKVFSDAGLMQSLNSIVHCKVRDDIISRINADTPAPLLIESAILSGSGLHELCDEIWLVEASEETRITRVVSRNGFSPEHVRERMAVQQPEFDSLDRSKVVRIDNSGLVPVMPQVLRLLDKL